MCDRRNVLASVTGAALGHAASRWPAALLVAPPHAAGASNKSDVEFDVRVLGALSSLLPNRATTLGRARVMGEFNTVARRFGLDRTGPRSRDFSIKMVWSPERRRALFTGANHGAPHRLNDVWEFDLAAMAWLLLYPPDLPRSYRGLGDDASDVHFKDGLLMTLRGGPASIAHTWWGLTYDPGSRQLLFMNTWLTQQADAVRQLGGDPSALYTGPPLWAFEPARGRWMALKTEPPAPQAPFGAMLEYVPELDGAIWHMNNYQMRATWLYQPAQQRWSELRANVESRDFDAQAPGPELVGYHDPRRKLVIVRRGSDTFHFDTMALRWRRVAAQGPADMPLGHDARTPFCYDAASGHGLLVDFRTRALWAYDPDALRWSRLDPRGSPMPDGRKMLAYADAAHNALVVIDDTTVWAYRYRATQ